MFTKIMGTYTIFLGLVTTKPQNLLWVASVKIVPLQFILEFEGMRDQGSLNELNKTIHGVVHDMQWLIFHGLPNFAPRLPKRWV
jgi:hypothetical protein